MENNNNNDETQPKKFSGDVKRTFLEIVSTYGKYQEQMDRKSDITQVAETLGGIIDAAEQLIVNEAEGWFDKQTVKRNLGELKKLGAQFDKVVVEAKGLDQRMSGLYEDMGHILQRYYKLGDINEEDMKQRLGMNESWVPDSAKPDYMKESAMSELDLMAQESKDFKSFTKSVYKEYPTLPKNSASVKWLEDIYNNRTNESLEEGWFDFLKSKKSKNTADAEPVSTEDDELGKKIISKLKSGKGIEYPNSQMARVGKITINYGDASHKISIEQGRGTFNQLRLSNQVRDGIKNQLKIGSSKYNTDKRKTAMDGYSKSMSEAVLSLNEGGDRYNVVDRNGKVVEIDLAKPYAEDIAKKHRGWTIKSAKSPESTNEVKTPSEFKSQNGIQVHGVDIVNGKQQWVGYVKLDDQAKFIPAVQGNSKASVTARANKLYTQFKANAKKEKLKESFSPKDIEAIKKIVGKGTKLLDLNKVFDRFGWHTDLIVMDSVPPHLKIKKKKNDKETYVLVNKKYVQDPDFVIGNIAGGLNESVKKDI
jgi:hypothetical protein